MSYADAHIHLADLSYAGKIEQVIADAAQNNVAYMLSNATDYETSLQTIKLAKQFSQRVLGAVGIHPSTVIESEARHIEKFGKMIDENAEWITAIGEIGLDGKYSLDEGFKERQRAMFRHFLKLAEERNLPVIVHSRQAVEQVFRMLADFRISRVLLHWYDGPVESLATIKERGYFISIGPTLLYSRRIEEIAREADPSIILSETDGPISYRDVFPSQLTQPWFVIEVVRRIAKVKNLSNEILRSLIFSNFLKFINP